MWQAMPRTLVDAPPVTPFSTAAAAAAPLCGSAGEGCCARSMRSTTNRTSSDRGSRSSSGTVQLLLRYVQRRRVEEPAAHAPFQPRAAPPKTDISFGKRADADIKPVTIVPKSVRGYKLPPSSLLLSQRRARHRARGRAARRGARAGREMRRVRRQRPGDADQSRPGRHDLRVPARRRRESTRASPDWPTISASRWPPSPS